MLIIIKEIATPVALSYKFPRPVYFFVVHAPPRRVGQGRGLPPKPRSVKITKTCGGAQRGKVDFNPLKLGRQLQGRIQFCPINICLTHESVDLHSFFKKLILLNVDIFKNFNLNFARLGVVWC